MIRVVIGFVFFYSQGFFLFGEIDSLRRDFRLYESKQLLLPMMLHIEGFLLQPFRQLYLWHWIRYSLQDSRNADHLLYLSRQSLEVVIPIQHLTDVDITVKEGIVLCPFVEELALDLHVCVEDLGRDCPLGYWTILRVSRDNEVTAESSFAFDDFWTEEFCQSSSGTECNTLRSTIIIEIPTQNS